MHTPTFHSTSNPTTLETFAVCEELRVKLLRMQFPWDVFEPTKGDYHTNGFDSSIDAAQAFGMEFIGQFAHFPDWSNGGGDDKTMFHNVADWENYIALMVQRYKPGGDYAISKGWGTTYGIRYWEILNEPDFSVFFAHPNIADYSERILKPAYRVLKAADPNCIVIGGGASWQTSAPKAQHWTAALYAQGARNYFDVLSHHVYPGSGQTALSNTMTNALRQVRQVMDNNGDEEKPCGLTEYGWNTPGEASEPGQAIRVRQTYNDIIGTNPDVDFICWTQPVDPSDGSTTYGLVGKESDGFPRKLAFAAFRDDIPG
jgi:hypothetical protein